MRAIFFILISLTITPIAWGQRYERTDSLAYDDQVQVWTARANDSATVDFGRQFANFWATGPLTDAQKKTFEGITAKMQAKNYKFQPYLVDLHLTLLSAVDSAQLSSSSLDNMLNMIDKSVDHYDRRQVGMSLKTLLTYFQQNALYLSNYNSLYATAQSVSFEFIEPAVAEEISSEAELSAGEDEFLDQADEPEEVAVDDWGAEEESDWSDGWGGEDDWGNEDENTDEPGANAPAEEETTVLDYIIEEPLQPEITGAVMRFDQLNLTFSTPFDSANLVNTSGALLLENQVLVGEGGKFDWVMTGLSPDSVYCTLTKYNFDIRNPRLSAEKAQMTYVGKIKEPVEGVFQFASQRHTRPQDARYPRFKSYNSNISVDVFNNPAVNPHRVNCVGGFSLQGARISSTSLLEGETTVEIWEANKKKVRTVSKQFVIGDSLIESNRATVAIYQRSDSIYHPGAQFKYVVDSSQLILQSGKGSFKRTPFVSSNLKMDIHTDLVEWNMRTDSLNVSTLTARDKVPVLFESHEYFNEDSFNDLARMYDFHPLIMAVGHARKTRNSSFYADDLAQAIRQQPKVVRAAMKDLSERGYIDYSPQTGYITIRRKGFHYVLSKGKLKDFDDLLIASYETNGPNATIRLEQEELDIRGIEKFTITDILNVSIKPDDNQVTLLGNRDFRFNGTLYSGNFEFVGKDFTFSYDSFKVDLPQIDSISFLLADENGNRRKVDNTLQSSSEDGKEKTSGTLYINDPNNKAARKSRPDYPRFSAETGAIVYFDSKNILDGAYDKSVYFVIPPFAIDSLNNADPSAIGFKGTLYSGIFPPIEEVLQVRADNSMGFEHEVASKGYQLYDGEGVYRNNLTLDANGLHGEGTIDFLTTNLEAENFTFFMDSVTTVGTVAQMQAGSVGSASFPQAYVEDYRLKWLPQQDSMIIYNRAKPFDLYDQTASLDSVLIVTQTGLLGAGTLATRGSEAFSKNMRFRETNFSARNANFEIKSDNPKKPALAGEDVRLEFDLNANLADISPEVEGVAAIEFPYAMFRTSITNAQWNLDDETVRMSKPADVAIENSYFYATRKDLDSLAFSAEEAIYRIPLQQLDVSGVPFITVADAKITPENNRVQILENAKLDRFTNATLVIDTLNEYHNLYNGTIDILSRNEFRGKATYELVSASDTFAIELTSFERDSVRENRRKFSMHTVADGQVSEDQHVVISPGMLYRGKVKMHAVKEALELDGEVKLDFKTIPGYNTWISYSSDAGQKQLVFDFDQSETDTGDPLVAGLHLSGKDNSLYTTFVTNRRSPDDYDLFKPTGLLSYNEEKQEYIIRSPKRDKPDALAGEVFTFNERTQTVSFEGPLNLMPGPEEGIELTTVGSGQGRLDSSAFALDAFMLFDMDLPGQSVELMGKDLNAAMNRAGAPAANTDRTRLLYKIAELVGDEKAKEYDKASATEYTSVLSIDPRLEKTIGLSDVQLSWSSEQKAWYSTASLGISNVGFEDINARATGYLEIKPTETGNVLNLFIQATADSWYYFSYQNNRMAVWAYNEEFCDLIGSKSKIDKAGSDDFAFYLSDIAETLTFVNRFRKTYLDINEPYNFDVAPPLLTEQEQTKEKKEEAKDGF
ncbi:MAG: hypothetical protein WA960_18840 [Tunicatimonas sp.]